MGSLASLAMVPISSKPILVEGHAGLGKTEVAKVLASFLGTRLIRLQCYEGLDVSSAVYEWNYQKQLLAIKIEEGSDRTVEEKERHIFSREFLLARPLLQSIQVEDASPVLLIDEIDRADEAFEAFLLELLSDYQITQLGVGRRPQEKVLVPVDRLSEIGKGNEDCAHPKVPVAFKSRGSTEKTRCSRTACGE